MKKLLFFASLFFSSALCAQTALHGLFTPVPLQPEQTTIYLRDYLVDEKPLSVNIPRGLYQVNSGTDTLILAGKMDQKIALLDLVFERKTQSLVLINPSARPVNITTSARQLHGKEVRIIGDFNNWNRESQPLQPGKGVYSATYTLEPGQYAYKFFIDGQEVLDPDNPDRVSNGMGGYNNILTVAPEDFTITESYTVTAPLNEVSAADDPQQSVLRIINTSATNRYIALWNNTPLIITCSKSGKPICSLTVPSEAQKVKRSYIRIYAFAGSHKGRDQLIPLEYGKPLTSAGQLERTDWHQARMYFLMVDRFYNGNPANDRPLEDPSVQPIANYKGGDLVGVHKKIKDGFFRELGTNTIWLSPITQNPYDAWGLWDKGKVHSTFSGYHGYWPISNTRVDTRFGSEATVKKLLTEAHDQHQNVVLDYVANHVHIKHPIYQQHKDWATDLYLPDGTKNTEKWDEHRLTTWFDDHLPTLDLRRYEVVDPLADSALYWIDRYDFDGFRHDATKHIDELYWRTLTYRIKRKTDKPVYQIGETYGSPQLINSYISTGMLDAQFDFNLYDAAVGAFAYEGGDLENLVSKVQQALNVYGYHHLMGNISGNQDRVRFITLANGDVRPSDDAKRIGWDTEIGAPEAEAYRRLALLHAFNYAIPGIPCIYYGDEYGLPGAGDPDNRRMMQFEKYNELQAALREKVKTLNALRASSLPLLYGTTEAEILAGKVLKITRSYLGESVSVFINTSLEEVAVTLPATKGFRHFHSSQPLTQNTLTLPPLSFEYFTFKTSSP